MLFHHSKITQPMQVCTRNGRHEYSGISKKIVRMLRLKRIRRPPLLYRKVLVLLSFVNLWQLNAQLDLMLTRAKDLDQMSNLNRNGQHIE